MLRVFGAVEEEICGVSAVRRAVPFAVAMLIAFFLFVRLLVPTAVSIGHFSGRLQGLL